MKIKTTKAERVWLKIFGVKGCITCKHFNAETLSCEEIERLLRHNGKPLDLSFFWRKDEKAQNKIRKEFGEKYLGSGCSDWE